MPGTGAIEALMRRDRFMGAAGLAGIAGLAWVYLFYLAAGMDSMRMMAMPALRPWSAADFVFMFLMWAVMMVAMMTPSAAPMILLHAAIARKSRAGNPPAAATGAFAAGYLAVWTGFSTLATALQWGLEQAAVLSPTMVGASPWLGGALLIAAGAYQMTPLKQVCLRHCRSPVQFLAGHWRPGAAGAFRMGLHHGAYCVGCCWALMTLLFVGGVMNLLWIAALAVFVLVEKIAPRGALVGRVTGGVMVAGGLWMFAAA
jgi:predicted metal-binding membrane protein